MTMCNCVVCTPCTFPILYNFTLAEKIIILGLSILAINLLTTLSIHVDAFSVTSHVVNNA